MSLKERLSAAISEQFAEQVATLATFVQTPSQRNESQAAQDFVFHLLNEKGFDVDRWMVRESDLKSLDGFSPVSVDYSETSTVVGALRAGGQRGKTLILQGHTDIVPVGPLELWDGNPYSGRVVDGWMYGRGAGDMKNGLIAAIFAVDALRKVGLKPGSDLYIESVLEEECTGNGALSTIQRGYRADGVVITEPQGLGFTRAQVGVIWFKLRIIGKAAHAAFAQQGDNAVEAGFEVLSRLRLLEAAWNRLAAQQPHFTDTDRPVILNLGKIAGGDWASSVPAWCEMDLRIGLLPDQDPIAAQSEILEAIRLAQDPSGSLARYHISVEWNGYVTPGYVVPDDSPVVQGLRASHREALGDEIGETDSTGLNDCRIYALHGMDAVAYGAVAENVHDANERINLESVQALTLSLALFIARWCGTVDM